MTDVVHLMVVPMEGEVVFRACREPLDGLFQSSCHLHLVTCPKCLNPSKDPT